MNPNRMVEISVEVVPSLSEEGKARAAQQTQDMSFDPLLKLSRIRGAVVRVTRELLAARALGNAADESKLFNELELLIAVELPAAEQVIGMAARGGANG